RFTPTLVAPVAGVVGKHAGEVSLGGNARSGKARAGVGVRPSVAAVGGLEDFVDVIMREATAAFIHACDVDGPVARHVTSDLHVANEGIGVAHYYRGVPRCAVIGGEGDFQSAHAHIEVIPGDVHVSIVRRGGVVVSPARFPVITTIGVNAEMISEEHTSEL